MKPDFGAFFDPETPVSLQWVTRVFSPEVAQKFSFRIFCLLDVSTADRSRNIRKKVLPYASSYQITKSDQINVDYQDPQLHRDGQAVAASRADNVKSPMSPMSPDAN
jgi:hypothetical protein